MPTASQETPFWRFSDLKVSWTLRKLKPGEEVEGVKISGPAALIFFPSIDQKKPR